MGLTPPPRLNTVKKNCTFLSGWLPLEMGQTDGGLIGTSAKHASLSEWPLSWLDGISMGKTDGPVDDHKRQTQNGVVHQREPGYFSFDSNLNMERANMNKNKLTSDTFPSAASSSPSYLQHFQL